MGIRMSYQPVAAPLVAAYAGGVNQAEARQRQQNMQTLKYMDAQRQANQRLFQRRQWDIEDRDKNIERWDKDRAETNAWRSSQYGMNILGTLREIGAHVPPGVRTELNDLASTIRKLVFSPKFDRSNPEVMAALQEAYDKYNTLIAAHPEPSGAKAIGKNIKWLGRDGEFYDSQEEAGEGAEKYWAPDDGNMPQKMMDPDQLRDQENRQKAQQEQEKRDRRRIDKLDDAISKLEREILDITHDPQPNSELKKALQKRLDALAAEKAQLEAKYQAPASRGDFAGELGGGTVGGGVDIAGEMGGDLLDRGGNNPAVVPPTPIPLDGGGESVVPPTPLTQGEQDLRDAIGEAIPDARTQPLPPGGGSQGTAKTQPLPSDWIGSGRQIGSIKNQSGKGTYGPHGEKYGKPLPKVTATAIKKAPEHKPGKRYKHGQVVKWQNAIWQYDANTNEMVKVEAQPLELHEQVPNRPSFGSPIMG